jgi:hypothetical protein
MTKPADPMSRIRGPRWLDPGYDTVSDLFLRSALLRASRRMAASCVAAWFETHGVAALRAQLTPGIPHALEGARDTRATRALRAAGM